MSQEDRLPEAVQVARLALMREFPYLSAGLMAFIPVNEPKCPTMGVDQFWRLYFNEKEVAKWTEDEIKGVLWHELTHLTHEHHDRARIRGAYDVPWNVAADAEINDDLREIGLALPKGVIYPETIHHKDTGKPMDEHLLAEEYYDALNIKEVECSCPQSGGTQQQGQSSGGQSGSDGDQSSPQSQQGSGQDSGGQSGSSEATDEHGGGSECHDHSHGDSAQTNSGGSTSTDGQGDQSSPQSGAGQSGAGSTDPNCPIHGKNPIPHSSSSGMKPAPWEKQESAEGNDPRKVGQAEGEIIRRQVAEETKDVAEKNRGTVPGFMERWAKEKLRPQVPWRQVLRGAIRSMVSEAMGATDYTRRKPSRRQSVHGNVVMPSLRQPTPEVAMAIDTSGSMGTKELAAGLAEVKGVLRGLGLRDMTVFAVDHAVGFAEKVTNPNKIKLIGGGGTDMGIAIQQAQNMRPLPHFLIIFTDGYTPWPSKAPTEFKLIVVSTTDAEGPEYAKTVHIDMERGR